MTLEQVGTVGVDAGMIWIGDPCYIMGDDAYKRVRVFSEFAQATLEADDSQASSPLGTAVGMAISSGFGDGVYPVLVRRHESGLIAEVRVVFIEDSAGG